MLRLLFFALMLLGAVSRAVAGSGPPAASAEDSLKARIWTVVAKNVWKKTGKAPDNKPKDWKTVNEFVAWCNDPNKGGSDKSGLITLKKQTYKSFKGKEATARQLIDIITANIKSNQADLQSVKSADLRKELDGILASGHPKAATMSSVAHTEEQRPGDSTADGKKQSIENSSSLTKSTSAVPSNASPAPQVIPSDAGVVADTHTNAVGSPTDKKAPTDNYPVRRLYLAITGLIGLVVGAILGAFLWNRWGLVGLETKPDIRRNESQNTDSATRHNSNKSNNANFQRYEAEAKEISKLKREIADLQAKLALSQQPLGEPKYSSVPTPAASLAAITAEPSTPVATPAPVAPAVAYASAQRGGFIEQEKVFSQSMNRMQLLIRPEAGNADRATFGLSPDVDKNWLIERGLDQLSDYFDYTPTAGRPVSVTEAKPGILKRQGNGWQVATKAQLTVR